MKLEDLNPGDKFLFENSEYTVINLVWTVVEVEDESGERFRFTGDLEVENASNE